MTMHQQSSTTRTRLLGISGSIRSQSNCTAVLRSLQALLPDSASIELFPLDEIPLYNADLDGPAPPAAVAELKQAISRADGIVLCSPEYNYGIPGVLKNAIDWASRPGFKSPLRGKPVLIMTASPGAFGGARAQAEIRAAFAAVLARPIARQHVAIPAVNTKIKDGRIADEPTVQFLTDAVGDLLAEIDLVNGRRA